MELILGTAEFGPKPYGEGVVSPPDQKEVIRILNLAWEAGIRTLDCADTYGTEPLEKYFGGFERLYKSRIIKGSFYHYKPGEPYRKVNFASVYEEYQAKDLKEVIVPLNINNTRFVGINLPCIPYIRSVFDRGCLLKQGYTLKDCLHFAKRHLNKGIIIGVNSTKELDEILRAWDGLYGY